MPWSSEHGEVRIGLVSEPREGRASTSKTVVVRSEKPSTDYAVGSTRSNREQPRRFPLACSATATSHGSATVRRGPARRRTP